MTKKLNNQIGKLGTILHELEMDEYLNEETLPKIREAKGLIHELHEQLHIDRVSQQRELLLAFLEFYHNPKHNTVNTTFIEDVGMFLSNNCG